MDDITAPTTDLTAFQQHCLLAIADEGEVHGLGIKDWLDDYYEDEINHGRLYPNLDTLCHKGLVQKEEVDRRTNHYSLTTRGKRELQTDQAFRQSCVEGIEA